ncbi:MAG: hydroxymethylbilane synthase [Oceanicaulis sp.]
MFKPQAPMAIATRTSPLAMAQSLDVQARLAAAAGVDTDAFPIMGMKTTGDKITDRALLEAGGKGLFTKELETALLSGEARFAVHSMKDVPTKLPEGLEIAAILKREDPRDVLLTRDGTSRIEDLPENAVLGTASIRRQAQALALRPDLKVVLLRGNVDTRLEKLRSGEVDATFLARAGLRRLGRDEAEREPLEPESVLPAPAQGCVGVEIRTDDEEARQALKALDHAASHVCAAAERGFLAALDGSCRTPIAAYAVLEGDTLHLRGEALSPDGEQRWARETRDHMQSTDPVEAAQLGRTLGLAVREAGGEALLRAVAEGG